MKKSEKSEEDVFKTNFKKLVKGVLDEEEYIKKEDLKILMKDILEVIQPLIAKEVKNHFVVISNYIVGTFSEPEKEREIKNAKTS